MNGFLFLCSLILILGLLIYAVYRQEKKRPDPEKKRREILLEANLAYREGLSDLKARPNNADLKEQVLRLGREYSGYTRKFQGSGGVTIYDEVAIMNDINAACANSVSFQNKSNQSFELTIEQR